MREVSEGKIFMRINDNSKMFMVKKVSKNKVIGELLNKKGKKIEIMGNAVYAKSTLQGGKWTLKK